MPNWYNGTKLINMRDVNGDVPAIYISNSNRSAGKTTWFGKYVIDKYKSSGSKFMLIYRYKNELSDISGKFFNDIGSLFYKDDKMTDESRGEGAFRELYLNNKSCGFACPLSLASKIKRYSHFFTDVDTILFDEYQEESGEYVPDEITKFKSIYRSVARGHGQAVRDVKVFMIGNQISSINPYYIAFGVNDRLQSDTRFLRGEGWVVEQNLNKDVLKLQQNSAFDRAFKDKSYTENQGGGSYLNDNRNFVESRPEGKSIYCLNFTCENITYSVSLFTEHKILYVDNKCDKNFKYHIAVNSKDHNSDTVRLGRSSNIIANLRRYYDMGAVRFKSLECQFAFMQLVQIVFK